MRIRLPIGDWWNPFSWGDDIANMMQGISEVIQMTLSNLFVGMADMSLSTINNLFNTSIQALKSEVALTPNEFSTTLVATIKSIVEVSILPIAGVILTYIFCLEVYRLVTDKNKGGDFEIGNLLFLFIKTSVMILLVTNSFNIAMGFSDLGKWVVDQTTGQVSDTIRVDDSVKDEILKMIEPVATDENGVTYSKEQIDAGALKNLNVKYTVDFKLGEAFVVGFISMIALLFAMVMVGIIYIVAWSRIVMMLIYISIAPIPMATLMNNDWVGSIGQNYIKNLLALMLQGFLMLVLLVIYSGLLDHVLGIMRTEGNALMALIMMMCSMAIVVKMLMSTHSLAKSITGAS